MTYEKVNTAFLGTKIAAGEHQIEIVYHAPGLQMGKWLSLIGVVLFIILCRLHHAKVKGTGVAKD